MKAVVQRVASARVEVEGEIVGEIGRGLLVYLGCAPGDDESKAARLAKRVVEARVFADEQGRMNLDLAAAAGSLLVVSQFTLLGDTSQRRPYFGGALAPAPAEALYRFFQEEVRRLGFSVASGRFGAHMLVTAGVDGPVTLLYEQ
jgi:D-tyrosyl-tRNA(Tyr) deacylase